MGRWRSRHRLDLMIGAVLGTVGLAYGLVAASGRVPGLLQLVTLRTPYAAVTRPAIDGEPAPYQTIIGQAEPDFARGTVPGDPAGQTIFIEQREPPLTTHYRERIDDQLSRRQERLEQLERVAPGGENFRRQLNEERARLRRESGQLHTLREQLGQGDATTLSNELAALERTQPMTSTVGNGGGATTGATPPPAREVRSLDDFLLQRINDQTAKRQRRIAQLQQLAPGTEEFRSQINRELAARRAELEQLIALRESRATRAELTTQLERLEALGADIPDPKPSPPALFQNSR